MTRTNDERRISGVNCTEVLDIGLTRIWLNALTLTVATASMVAIST